jgi:integrase
MMARLGMRAGEVRQLNLNDIDWIEGEIHVRAGKSRRERTLPLLEEVGKALSVYLREERPESAERSISSLEESVGISSWCARKDAARLRGICRNQRHQGNNQCSSRF